MFTCLIPAFYGLSTDMLITHTGLDIPDYCIEWKTIRARGPGGQHVNKVASAVQLRFDAQRAPLAEDLRQRLLALPDQRIGEDGVIVIRADRYRSQQRNRDDALERLAELLRRAALRPKKRRPTRPSQGARQRRMDAKRRRGRLKALRRSGGDD